MNKPFVLRSHFVESRLRGLEEVIVLLANKTIVVSKSEPNLILKE